MYILTNDNVAFASGETIEAGRWINDPTMDTYRIKSGDTYQYAVMANFGLHQVDALPDDFAANKYCYSPEDGFYLNQNWSEATEPQDEIDAILTELESEVGINE